MSSIPTTFAYGLPKTVITAGDTAIDLPTQELLEQSVSFDAGAISVTIHKAEKMAEVVVSSSHAKIRATTLIFSSVTISIGLFDIVLFLFKNSYFFHPYFSLTIFIAGSFLLATTILAIKSK